MTASIEDSWLGIHELGGQNRGIVLLGRAMPFKPFTLEGEQNVQLTWPVGSPIAVSQVLGAKESETQLKGRWSDKFVSLGGDTDAIAQLDGLKIPNVRELANLFDEVRRQGQLLEVSWLHFARHGYLKKFAQHWQTAHDLEWDMTFAWTSQADEDAVNVQTSKADLQKTAVAASGDAKSVLSATPLKSGFQTVDFVDAVVKPLAPVGRAAVALDSIQTQLQQGVTTPVDAVRRTISSLGGMALSYQSFILGMYQYPDQVAQSFDSTKSDRQNFDAIGGNQNTVVPSSLVTPGNTVVPSRANTVVPSTVSVGTSVAVAAANRVMISTARRARGDALRSQQALLRSVDPEILQVFFAREGQDLRLVSRDFFGVSDNWQKIAAFNGLTSSKLTAGQVVLVPKTFNE